MKATSTTRYIGGFRCESEHLDSGAKTLTDAPKDNHGQGSCFSPTDMCATSLAECALTTIAIIGKEKVDITGAEVWVTKIMSAIPPRKIAKIICEFHFSESFDQEQRTFIQRTAENCPVALSLHPELIQEMHFFFDQKSTD